MIEEDLFEQEIQKKKRRVLVLLVCLFVLAGGGFVARKSSLAEETIAVATATLASIAEVALQPTPSETSEEDTSQISEENSNQTTIIEDDDTETNDTGTAIDSSEVVTSAANAAEEETERANGELAVGGAESEAGSSDNVGAGQPIVNDRDDDDTQYGVDNDSSDGASGGADAIIGEESTTDADDVPDSETDVDDTTGGGNQSEGVGEDVDAVVELSDSNGEVETGTSNSSAGELVGEDQTNNGSEIEDTSATGEAVDKLDGETEVIRQGSDEEQMTDFQPPPGQLPVTGTRIIDWGIAPFVAISLVILLVGAGASTLFSSKHRRY